MAIFFGLCLLAIWQTLLFVLAYSFYPPNRNVCRLMVLVMSSHCPLGSTVMILGVTILRKKYPMAKYLCVFLIIAGVALFLYKPNKGSSTSDEHKSGFGEMLLLLSLTLDGLTGVAQDHMRARYQTGANHMMLNINMWSTLVLGISEL
ncbi:solute carrier family 35 member B1-like [Sinocyclocheilus rhinocerous]|uniref:solute carrier family 35 member B1-like n=1 Tax=Sinocyclocheilus rhinocerous TaxID=307959 RepID=UPI0007B8C58B|nr:PREDICTED: solute carrier family 35 member B1-like [Sinocyclocheilus rhinocerous]